MTDSDVISVERVAAELTYELRQRILRPHEALYQLRLPGDDDPLAGTFAARTADGTVVGTAIVLPQECPWRPDDEGAWRLRGMATAPELRGHGVGSRVLRAAIDHVSVHGGRLLWCNARIPAVRFYEREGFRTHGDEWADPLIGPHIAMWRPL
jgi:GNAT superfamily N-acetyltransferase